MGRTGTVAVAAGRGASGYCMLPFPEPLPDAITLVASVGAKLERTGDGLALGEPFQLGWRLEDAISETGRWYPVPNADGHYWEKQQPNDWPAITMRFVLPFAPYLRFQVWAVDSNSKRCDGSITDAKATIFYRTVS